MVQNRLADVATRIITKKNLRTNRSTIESIKIERLRFKNSRAKYEKKSCMFKAYVTRFELCLN
jgi:hypothetical protein